MQKKASFTKKKNPAKYGWKLKLNFRLFCGLVLKMKYFQLSSEISWLDEKSTVSILIVATAHLWGLCIFSLFCSLRSSNYHLLPIYIYRIALWAQLFGTWKFSSVCSSDDENLQRHWAKKILANFRKILLLLLSLQVKARDFARIHYFSCVFKN